MNLSKSWNLHIISVALYSFSPHGWQLWGHVRPVFIVWALWSIIFWPSVLWYFSELHTPNNMSWPLIYWWLFVVVQSLQSCPTLCNPNPMDCSMPGFPVLHHLPEFAQANVHWVGDAIQPSHPLSSPTPAFNLSHNQGLFKWVSSSQEVAKVLEFQHQHQSFQWILRTEFLSDVLVGSPCSPRDSQESSATPQFKSINSSVLNLLHSPTLTSIHDHWKNHSLD